MLIKSTFREIRTSLARYLAIFAIVALGVGFFSGLKDCKASMVNTATNYLLSHNMYDYMLISSYGIDDESIAIAEGNNEVTGAEGSIQIDVLAESGGGDEAALKAISLPENINTLRLATGRLPEKADECVIDDYHIDSEGYKTGDTIYLTDTNDEDTLEKFRYREFKIVGTVNTPIYLDYQRGSTDIGNGSLETFFYIDKESFDTDYYTQLYLTLSGDEMPFTKEKEDRLKSAQDSMDELSEAITSARRDEAKREAQEELDEKKQEYEDNLAKYEREKAKAEKELDDAEDELEKGQKKLNSVRKKAKSTEKDLEKTVKDLKATIADLNGKISDANAAIADLEGKKTAVEAGIADAKDKKEKLEQAHQAGSIDDDQYNEQLAKLNSSIDGLNKNLKEINAGLAQAKAGLEQASAGKTKAEAGLSQAEKGLKKIDSGYDKLKKQQKKIDKGKKTLKNEERKAESEFDKAKKELDDAKDKLDKAQKKIDDMEKGNSYALSRAENAGYSSFDNNSSIVSNIARIFPVFFFLIAALVCMTTMTRMIDEQRTQIGILKALGYSNAQIVGKYMFYSGSAAFLGAVTGFFIGCKVFPAAIWNAYTMMYDFSDTVEYVIDPRLGLISLTAALLCSMGATWVSIAQDFKVAPSELIRPKTPPAGKRILLERIGPLWKRISFLYKVSFRNIFRDKKRFLMMVIGVSGCTALLIAGLGIRTTIARVAEHQFREISLYDFTTVFSKNMTEERKTEFLDYMEENAGVTSEEVFFIHRAEVSVQSDGGNFDVNCTAADPDNFDRFINLHHGSTPVDFPGEGEVVIVKKLNHDYGINIGDKLILRDGYRDAEFTVAGVCDNYVYDTIYMSTDTYEKSFDKKAEIKSAFVRLKGGAADANAQSDDVETAAVLTDEEIRAAATEAANYKNTAAVSVSLDVKDSVAKMMQSLDLVVYVVLLSAALLAFIVLYNLTNINITERIREIATIKVLGFNQFEVSQYVFRENLFLTAIAAVVGIPLGKWLLGFVIDNIVVKMIYFEPRLTNTDILMAVALTFVFAAVVNLAMQRRLRKVSMTESLKSVE